MRRRIISHLYRRQMMYFSVLNGDVNHRNEVAGRLVTNESWPINDLQAQIPITEGLSRGKVSYFSTSTSLKKDRHAVVRISTKNLKVKTKVIGQSETRKHNEEPIRSGSKHQQTSFIIDSLLALVLHLIGKEMARVFVGFPLTHNWKLLYEPSTFVVNTAYSLHLLRFWQNWVHVGVISSLSRGLCFCLPSLE